MHDASTKGRPASGTRVDGRFLTRASWALTVVLGAIALSFWLRPVARAHGNQQLAVTLGFTFLAGFFGLIAVAMLLRRRLASQIAAYEEQQIVLLEQNERLAAQAESQHRLADEARLMNRRLTEAQHVARLGYWEIDTADGSVFWSEEMYRLCGVEPSTEQPPTERFLSCIHPEDQPRMREVAAAAMLEFKEFVEQYRIVLPDGNTRTVQAQGRIHDDAGRRKLIGTVQDITERSLLEAQLRHAQKMEAVGQLAGGIAHDFNNLLTVISGYTSLLLTAGDRAPPKHEFLSEIRDAALRAATLTRQLLTFSRRQVLRPRALDLNDTVQSLAAMLRRLIGEHIELRTILSPNLDPVHADPNQVEMLIMNLAVNARDAMPDGGTLTIETANVILDESHAQRRPLQRTGPHVMVAVTDTGSGITPQVMDRIFEPFFTTKAIGKGTGLGLATVHGIAEEAGGYVWVYSEVELGTTFKVYFPRAASERANIELATLSRLVTSGSETILLVEDDASLRRMTHSLLARAGYEVIEAANGAEAMRLAAVPALHFDLVLSDMVMPEMGGRALAAKIGEQRPKVPVLLMSGYTRESLDRGSEPSLDFPFVEKPFTSDGLLRKVREQLDGRT